MAPPFWAAVLLVRAAVRPGEVVRSRVMGAAGEEMAPPLEWPVVGS